MKKNSLEKNKSEKGIKNAFSLEKMRITEQVLEETFFKKKP